MAKDFPEYTFAVADEEDFATEVKDLGLSESGEEVNAAILDEGGRRFAMEPGDFDADALRDFVTAFKKGGPAPHPPTPAPRLLQPLPAHLWDPGLGFLLDPGVWSIGTGESLLVCLLSSLFSFVIERGRCLSNHKRL